MYKAKTYLAVIPARGGSKGIPRKNITSLNGKPLIAYSIEAALGSTHTDRVIVSTDDNEIADVSKSFGAEVLWRPQEIAGDESPVIDTLFHVFSALDSVYDSIVLLQPTSPLRSALHIDEAIELHDKNAGESVVSVSPTETAPLLIREFSGEGALHRLLQEKSDIRRQDMRQYYRVNGAIYINRISELTKSSCLNDNKIGYVMSREYSIDIDEPLDLTFACAIQRQTSVTSR